MQLAADSGKRHGPGALTEEFGVIPELDFMQTPVGIIYIASRRVGQNIWARMVENVLPNLQQVAPIWEDGRNEHGFDGPMLSRWIVPHDDTNTMLLELRHISETEETTPAWWADRNIMLPAQLPISDDLREQQLQPGDYEAQVTQREIARHGLEHLGATDRGITMFRRQIRQGIQAVRDGQQPQGLFQENGRQVPTYCNDTVVAVPPAATPEEDAKLVRETGRRLAEEYRSGQTSAP